jgi:hypothetical protein
LLLEYSWPGNVRELRNVIARACVLVGGETIDVMDLDLPQPGGQIPSRDELLEGDLPSAVAKLEAAMIRKALECGGNRTEAAHRLAIHRQLLYTKIQRYGLAEDEASAKHTRPVGKADAQIVCFEKVSYLTCCAAAAGRRVSIAPSTSLRQSGLRLGVQIRHLGYNYGRYQRTSAARSRRSVKETQSDSGETWKNDKHAFPRALLRIYELRQIRDSSQDEPAVITPAI